RDRINGISLDTPTAIRTAKSLKKAADRNTGCIDINGGKGTYRSSPGSVVQIGYNKDRVAGSRERAADIEGNVGARIDRAAVVIVNEGNNGIRREAATGTRRDRNISAGPNVAAVIIQDLEGRVAHNVDVARNANV